jgi:hypothetical protein
VVTGEPAELDELDELPNEGLVLPAEAVPAAPDGLTGVTDVATAEFFGFALAAGCFMVGIAGIARAAVIDTRWEPWTLVAGASWLAV